MTRFKEIREENLNLKEDIKNISEEELKKRLKNNENNFNKIKMELHKGATKIVEQKKKEFNEKINITEDKIDKLENIVEKLLKKVKKIKGKNAEYEELKDSHTDEIKLIKDKDISKAKRITELEKENKDYFKNILEIKKDLVEKENKISNVEFEKEQLETQKKYKENVIKNLEEEKKEVYDKNTILQKKIKKNETVNINLQNQLEEYKKNIEK